MTKYFNEEHGEYQTFYKSIIFKSSLKVPNLTK